MVNKILKVLLVLLNIVIFSILFVNNYYVNNNMAYYRIMHRFDRDFSEFSNYFFLGILAFIIASLLIFRKGIVQKFMFVFLQLIVIIYYVTIEKYLSISITVIVSSLIILFTYLLYFTFNHSNTKNKLILIIYLLIIYVLFKTQIDTVINKLSSLDIEVVREYIDSFGIWAPIVSMLLMVLQAIVAPVPAFLITFANAFVFGWVKGAIISWSGAMIGASICFIIARFLGRDVTEKYAGKKQLKIVDNYFNKYGKLSILIARLLPFVPFDLVSYAAGLTSMSFLGFFFATGLGQLPATIIYSYFAGNITSSAKGILWIMSAMFIISATVFTFKNRKDI